jgi:hypothetical protein
MPHRSIRLLGLTAGLAVAAFAVASAASATGTWTVHAGSAPDGTTVAVTGSTTGTTPQIHFADTTSGQTLTCDSGTAPGTVKTGSGQSGTGLGHINGAGTTWTHCTGPGGLTFNVTGVGTWNINATSFKAPTTKGKINNVKATVVDPGLCSFTVTGSVTTNYSNKTHILSVPGSAGLTVSKVSGCFGIINNNDKAKFTGKYALSANDPTENPVTITSP